MVSRLKERLNSEIDVLNSDYSDRFTRRMRPLSQEEKEREITDNFDLAIIEHTFLGGTENFFSIKHNKNIHLSPEKISRSFKVDPSIVLTPINLLIGRKDSKSIAQARENKALKGSLTVFKIDENYLRLLRISIQVIELGQLNSANMVSGFSTYFSSPDYPYNPLEFEEQIFNGLTLSNRYKNIIDRVKIEKGVASFKFKI